MTLMESVPPMPWAELATKKDLEKLVTRQEFELRLDAMENRLIATFRGELNQLLLYMQSQTRTLLFTMIGTFVAFAGLVLGAIKL